MTRKPLSELHDWKLEHRDQDIRGRTLMDERGNKLGTIDELIVDTNTQYVEAVRLRDGNEISTSKITIDGRNVMLQGSMGSRDGRESSHEFTNEERLPIIDEKVDIGKREVRRGGIRVRTSVHEEPVSEDVTLREENIHVDRHPTNRPATEADINKMRDQEFEMRETDEEAVVNKRARVTEEVHIAKETEQHRKKIRDTERHTDVDIEDNRDRR